jgi:hypothetical protein
MQKEFFIILLICAISVALNIDYAEGLIEFKKYKVINSPKVCGDKMCSEIDEQRAKNGISSHDIKICGDKPCYQIIDEKTEKISKSSPLGQFKMGVALNQIQCKEELHLIIRTKNTFPACVKVQDIEKLRYRGWAISEPNQQKMFEKIVGSRIDEIKPSKVMKDHATLNIESEQISSQRYLIFEGDGWHRLHNVEITISGGEFLESLLTKTTDRGHLNMPWKIPDSVGGMKYHIFATDGIHEFEIDIPIST